MDKGGLYRIVMSLKVEGIVKKFKDTKVLNSIDLTIEKGNVFGLVGVNGAGKSTLLRSIAGIYKLDEGHIYFEDKDTFNDPSIRKDIFLVGDDLYFPFASTINALKDFYSSFYDFNEEYYHKYLEVFHLDANKPISNFSKGMKRQTALVFALAIRPKLLLLDEAFDGLDPFVRYTFKKILTELLEDNESTVIISSHNLKELENICDSYGILENGKIDNYGDLMSNKANINKYQIAFNDEKTKEDFTSFDLLHYSQLGKVITLVIKGNQDEVVKKLEAMHPLILDVLSVTFEELFIYEIERNRD